MKAAVLIDPERPKVSEEAVTKMLLAAGIEVSSKNADFGVVVGGDGIFSYYGRIISMPLLFVGVRSRGTTASKGYLAEALFDGLPEALQEIRDERYGVVEYRRLEVKVNDTVRGDIFTDVYLEKGADSNCLRYHLEVKSPSSSSFRDSAIANGVIICTSAGSTGYYSYIDKIRMGDWLEPDRFSMIPENEVGVCHIAPLLTARDNVPEPPLRYTVPWGSSFRITLTRDADARLFGLRRSRKGIRIRVGDLVEVRPSASSTRIIKLAPISKQTGDGISRLASSSSSSPFPLPPHSSSRAYPPP